MKAGRQTEQMNLQMPSWQIDQKLADLGVGKLRKLITEIFKIPLLAVKSLAQHFPEGVLSKQVKFFSNQVGTGDRDHFRSFSELDGE
jgi:hypothetical protein